MRLATIKFNDAEIAGIVAKKGILPVKSVNAAKGTKWAETMYELIAGGQLRDLTRWYNEAGKDEIEALPGEVPYDEVVYAPLYRNPKRIFGIGLNYTDHAGDIGDAAPQGFPGSFFKMADTLIGPGDDIQIPALKEATRTTAEAELGVVLAKDCRDVSEENWLDAVAGYTTILDMTEESILKGNEFVKGNPRYLTIVKNFPTQKRGRQHDTPPRAARIPAQQYPGLVRGRRALDRDAAGICDRGRGCGGVPHCRAGRICDGAFEEPGRGSEEEVGQCFDSSRE